MLPIFQQWFLTGDVQMMRHHLTRSRPLYSILIHMNDAGGALVRPDQISLSELEFS
jgi:hypothetical protein